MTAEERLAKQAQLQLLLQDVDTRDLAKMLWEIGYSAGLIVGTRDSADARMRSLLEVYGHIGPEELTDKWLQRAHDKAVSYIRASTANNMVKAAEWVGEEFRKTRRTP